MYILKAKIHSCICMDDMYVDLPVCESLQVFFFFLLPYGGCCPSRARSVLTQLPVYYKYCNTLLAQQGMARLCGLVLPLGHHLHTCTARL